MKVTKPQPNRTVYAIFRDKDTGKSIATTAYDLTTDQARELFRRAVVQESERLSKGKQYMPKR